MKNILLILLWITSIPTVAGQNITGYFPMRSNFIDADFLPVDNIFPIATVVLDIDGQTYSIPISYSLMHYSIDSSNFLIHGDFIDNYSFRVLDNGKVKPMFKKEALLLPDDWKPYLARTQQKIDLMKSKIDLKNEVKFLAEPDWWQNDDTPLSEDGSPMKFICQLELIDFIPDDCCLFIFFDPKKKLVKQIYQRD